MDYLRIRTLAVVVATVTGIAPDIAFARREPPVAEPGATAALPTAPATATASTTAPTESAPIDAAPPTATVPPPVVSPSAVAPKPAPDPRRKSGLGMVIGGLSTLGTVYLVTSMRGATMIDKAKRERIDYSTGLEIGPDRRGIAHGRALLVPAIGPFIALRHTSSASAKWLDVFCGTVQTASLVLAAVGFVRMRQGRAPRRWPSAVVPAAAARPWASAADSE
jgi:hypothetical protein